MEEIEIKGMEEDESQRWITILLILINIVLWGLIGLFGFFFFNIQRVNAQSQEVNMSAWSWGYSGSDSGAINNGTTTIVNWTTHNQLTTAYINAIFQGANGTSTISYSIATSNKKLCSLVNIYVWEGSNLLSTNPTWTCGQGSNTYFLFINLQLETKANYNYTVQVKFNSVGQIPTSYNLGSTSVTGTIRTELSDNLTNQTYIDGTNNIINNINNVASGIENAINDNNTNCVFRNYKINENLEIQGKYLQSDGTEANDTNYAISKYIPINANKTYNVIRNYTASRYYCLYDKDQTLISCTSMGTSTNFNITLNQEGFIRLVDYQKREMNIKGEFCQTNIEAILKGNPWSVIHPHRDEYDDTHELELDILDMADDIDLDDIDIDLDPDTSNWVWITLTSLINTSSLVFGMFISILSIGVIKLIFNR